MRAKTTSASRTADATPAADAERGFAIAGQRLAAPKAAPGLHLVATPIGNLGDITLRALQTLAGVDLVACEDTRITRRLLERFAIAATLVPYHEHNAAAMRPKLLDRLAQGGSVALVSDAGTPLISDPGFKLAREATAQGFAVTAVPGPSSVLTALWRRGATDRPLLLRGIPAAEQAGRRARLAELARIDATLVVFESGARVQDCLRDLAAAMGDRDAAICRELTKLHEEVRRGRLADLAQAADALETRGEFVLVIAPPAADAGVMNDAALDGLLRGALATSSVKDAVAQAAELSGRPRREVYARALELAKDSPRSGDDAE